MANALTTQIMQDGPRNTVVKFTGVLDTIPLANTVVLNPATYSLGPYGKPATWRIDFVEFAISDGIELTFSWDATTPQVIFPLSGRGNKHFKNFGGISGYLASALPGWTGSLDLSVGFNPGATAVGTPAGSLFTYMVVLDLVKQGPNLS